MAKKSKSWELFGTFRWSKVFPVNRDMEGPEGNDYSRHGGMYITDFIMDEDNLEKFEASGSNWKVYGSKKSEREKLNLKEGEYLIRPRRKHDAPFAAAGGPPVVVQADGTPINEEDGMGIGNDSKGYMQYTTYETTLQTGSRLDGIQLTEWIQYPLPQGAGAKFENRGTTVVTQAELDDDDSKPRASKAKEKETHEDLEDDDIPL